MIKVTYAIDTTDPKPTVEVFSTFDEAHEWIEEEMQSRVEWAVSHSPYVISGEDEEALRQHEWSLVRIEEEE